MSCGTPLIASDIPVHRWVNGEAAEYFIRTTRSSSAP